ISSVCRKVARRVVVDGAEYHEDVTPERITQHLGVPKYRATMAEEVNEIGVATGLAWTEVGGELLTIEAVTVPGKGLIKTTGKLGEVMQESVQAAFSFVKARSPSYGVKPSLFGRKDIHVHLPEGAVPKDGPSAGVGMVTAMISTLTGIAVRRDVAMTGEVTFRGRVLPIGGLKEKLLAALRAGLKTILLPKDNEKDLADIPKNVLDTLDIYLVSTMDEVLKTALAGPLTPITPSADAVVGDAPDAVTH
ncbi:MAG: S16 family serine protease, partial [Vicinamibacteria bacterium]